MKIQELLQKHLEFICNSVGSRMLGSAQNFRAADYIELVLHSTGLQVHRQRFDCPAWQCDEYSLFFDGVSWPLIVNPFSPSCDITAKIIPVGTLAELQSAQTDNRICVLYGDLSKEPLSWLSNPVYLPPHHREIMELLRKKSPLAVIAVSLSPGYSVPIIEDWDFGIPSVTVSAETGLKLLRNPTTSVSLQIQSCIKDSFSYNVLGTDVTTKKRRVVLCAHYDTKPYTVGGFDNGSGIATLLALAQRLTAKKELQIGFEFVAFSGEEYSKGGDTYLAQFGLQIVPFGNEVPHTPFDLDNVLMAVNLDGIGALLGTNTVSIMSASDQLQETIKRITKSYQGMLVTDPWPASNHYDFYTHHIPSIALNSVGMTNLIHHERDTLEWISYAKLEEVVEFVEKVVVEIQDKSPGWARN